MQIACPDCKTPITNNSNCQNCGWQLKKIDERVINLLPSNLTSEKINEDLIHLKNKEDFSLWRDLIFKKRFYIERLLNYWKDQFFDEKKKSFLEIGGGMCYISCVMKSLYPEMKVWATDVSPNYLSQKSSRLQDFFDVKIDQYAAVDGEHLPFPDNSFDIIFIAHSIHHIGNTESFFREVNRVLSEDGIFYGVDHIAAKWDKFYRRDAENAHKARGEPFGIHERVIRLSEYELDLKNAGIKKYKIKHEKNRKLKNLYEMKIKNYWSGVTVSISFNKNK